MALEFRPNCEFFDIDLPFNSLDARICSYECTPHVCASPIVVVDFWATSGSSLQPFFVIARHTFVALRKGNKLFAADDVVDVIKRLCASMGGAIKPRV